MHRRVQDVRRTIDWTGMKRWQVAYVIGAVSTAAVIGRSVRKGHTAEIDRAVTRAIQKRKGPRFAKVM